jgi:sec-independent protein translocase protein TatC
VEKPGRVAMPFLEHLEELRRRLIISIASVLVISIGGYFLSDVIVEFLTRPIDKVYFMGVTEAFAVKIKVSLFFGLFASLPVIFYQAWRFVLPGLTRKEVVMVLPMTVAMTVFFFLGASFCFFVVLPVGITFLLGFGTESLEPMIAIGRYVSFVGWMTISFGLVFELPVVTFLLGRLGVVDAPMLRKGRRYAIVGILIVAAVATPSPDMFSQLMLAGPLYLLYELSVALVAISARKRGIEPPHVVSNH